MLLITVTNFALIYKKGEKRETHGGGDNKSRQRDRERSVQ